MRGHRLSLGKYGLALVCSYPFRGDVEVPEKPVGKAARVGRIVHRCSELHAKRKPLDGDAMFEAADTHELAEAFAIFNGPLRAYIEEWRERACVEQHAEMRLRYDAATDTVKTCPRRDEPGYTPPGDTETSGEIDLAVRINADEAEVEDIKTGSARNVDEAQAVAYAVLVSRRWPVKTVRFRYLYALKTKLNPTPWIVLDVDTLDAEAGRIAKVLRNLPTAEPNPPADESICKFRCPLGRTACPAWVSKDAERLEEAGYFA